MKPHERMNWIADEFQGNAFEKAILFALSRFCNPDDECWPSVSTLAACAGMGTTSFRKHLQTLILIGAVSFRNRPGRPKLYRLHCDSEVVTPTRTRRTPQHVRVDEHNKNIPGHASRPTTQERKPSIYATQKPYRRSDAATRALFTVLDGQAKAETQ